MEVSIRAWRVRPAGAVGYWLFWDPTVETVSLTGGAQPRGGAGTEDVGITREGREAEAGRAISPDETAAFCGDPLQFALEEVDDG